MKIDMIGDSIQEQYEQFKDLMYQLGQAILKACEPLLKLIDDLEPYQKFEILHPRKKPRGSIRRARRKRR